MFISRTQMAGQMRENTKEVIKQLINHSLSYQFREPVNYIALGLLDYPVKIRNPMDLSTVYKKLKKRQYNLVEECLSDIFLIWQNCRTYNSETHPLHQNAKKLIDLTKKLIRNYLFVVKFNKEKVSNKEVNYDQSNQLTNLKSGSIEGQLQQEYSCFLQMRQSFIRLLEKCQDEQAIILFMIIKRHCPRAIVYDKSGNANMNMRFVDENTLDLVLKQMNRWKIQKAIDT